MSFNSLDYVFFLIVVVTLYFSIPHRFRWVLLLVASYYFYMCWRADYIILIVVSTLIDYFAGLAIGAAKRSSWKKAFLALSLTSNLGLLLFFKYYTFINANIEALLGQFNIFYDAPAFGFLLPVGISFYTFQSMSYTIDVYRGQKTPEKHLGVFALYIAYFPQLVAGPIERSTNLFPQLFKKHDFDANRVVEGLRLILWGMFKKVVIADRLAAFVEVAYNNVGLHAAPTALLAAYFFAIQVYCDFSGYSDIALGSAKLMGVELMVNFNKIYWSQSVTEYWRRNHVSLTTWFRDYVYIPLGGGRVPTWRKYLNVLIVFFVSGLWHGANWTYVFWGTLNGVYLVYELATKKLRQRVEAVCRFGRFPRLKQAVRMFMTFNLIALGLIFFRARSMSDAFTILKIIATPPWGPLYLGSPGVFFYGLFGVAALFAVEYVQKDMRLEVAIGKQGPLFRWGFYLFCLMSILLFGVFDGGQFIYFQF
ncbi:MAG: MBOAT family protein [Myxococcales bacterium]|nr:MAG: MBOAT family protein [Myxococcales bacterium]